MNTSKERGNVIFFILVAIVLFAALGSAVTYSGSTGGNAEGLAEDKAHVLTAEILSYGRQVSEAVSAMRLDGCDMTDISFENNVVTGYTNGTNTYCQVFSIDGGQLNWPDFTSDLFDANAAGVAEPEQPIFTIKNQVPQMGSDGVTAESYDLVMIVEGLQQTACEVINEKLYGSPTINAADKIETKYDGTINTTSVYTFPAAFNGVRHVCFQDNNGTDSGTYTYYYVISAR